MVPFRSWTRQARADAPAGRVSSVALDPVEEQHYRHFGSIREVPMERVPEEYQTEYPPEQQQQADDAENAEIQEYENYTNPEGEEEGEGGE
jgi:hypothetical protein